ncbi:hypothetical protein CEV31_4316 [Brucella thiophenivorans]|uniref:Uncharacterized protein n=1 Tax=Brucella thiophenivorans TaxID=571255 RepID=A0A256FRV6_9HYPH|nr:hypothetical protein CEV31_4316 [Brucella thiophenivorans]
MHSALPAAFELRDCAQPLLKDLHHENFIRILPTIRTPLTPVYQPPNHETDRKRSVSVRTNSITSAYR